MSDLNQVCLIGRLVRDADLKYTANGKAVSKFSIAVNKNRKVGDEWKDNASFFEVVVWGQIGESLKSYLTKGKQIAIIGELTQERWEQDGQNRSKVTVTATTIQLLGEHRDDGTATKMEFEAVKNRNINSLKRDMTEAGDSYGDEISF